jgi:hypothetical protein
MAEMNPITRRTLIAASAATAAATSIPAAAAVDPIYAAIERHMQTCMAHEAACEVSGNLHDDDPEMPEAEKRTHEAWDAMTDAAVELLNVEPTTKAGASALLRHVASTYKWGAPDSILLGEETQEFLTYALRHVAAALESMEA